MEAKVVTYHEICEDCVDFSPHLETKTLYAECAAVCRELTIYCKNDDLCRRTIERYKQFLRDKEVRA